MTSTVYSFGRDHGHFGRILNQTVMVEDTLHVRNNHEIYGFCFADLIVRNNINISLK